MRRRLLFVFVAALALGALAFFFVLPAVVERRLNRVTVERPYVISDRARELHSRLFVADLHADTLLWDRDPLARSSRGHADLPRLREGNVSLQFFTAVTKTPRGMNIERNEGDTDNITPLVFAMRWPRETWTSLKARALHQARRLREAEARSGGALVILRSADDLERHLERWRVRAGSGEQPFVAAVLGVEGAHALEGDPANLDALFEAGYRMVGFVHFFDNEFGGSAHGAVKGGLTGRGRELLRRMEARGVIADLAHASARTLDDVTALATRPVVVSHTGVRGTCDNARNLSDEQLRRVAATGGVVGIGFWETAACGADARSIARAVRHAVGVVGARHVALGSDFDGAVAVPFDASGVALLTEALLAEGLAEDEIELIMGGNVVRLLAAALPR
ncbi:MAG TPA: dipeptidase [Pyrinomonadaceae bacterium]|nr:dipeptidase [Pyrinomonadaceae bacterium]